MLTVLRYCVPSIKDIHCSIMVEYCALMVKHYCKMENKEEVIYWCKMAHKYLMKRFDIRNKKRG